LEQSCKELKPNLLSSYIYDLADSFNEFYQALPVLKADEDTKNARLKLVESVKIVLATGMHILGVPVLEEM
jgi:arginyl-tRNA synthetase